MVTSLPTDRLRRPRRGMALLITLFVVAITSLLLLGILESNTAHMAATRNTADYERALYLAGAGVHHALALLEADTSWTGSVSSTEFPAGSGNYFSATAVDGGSGTVIITGVGQAGAVTRRLSVTVSLAG